MAKYLTFLWGEDPVEEEQTPKTYTFKNEGEREAFLKGVRECEGWMGYDYFPHEEPRTFKMTDFNTVEEKP